MCLDVARDAMQMHSSGAGLSDIRSAIEQKYRPRYPTMTPTPAAPAQEPTAPPVVADASSDMPAGLPPLPVTPFPSARPQPIVRAIYTFAAQHPEVLRKVPCFCGCENRGHRDNDDCFVAARDANGRVTAWEPHGAG